MRIALIGAGKMGRPILERLAAAGHDCTMLARSPEARAAAMAEGLCWQGTVADAVKDAEIVFIVVLRDEDVREVCLGPAGALAAMRPGAVLVQHTTSDPTTALLLAEEAARRDVHVLDAALSGGPHDIAAGRLTLWVGGDEAVLGRVRPVLAAYASPILSVGALGNGQRVKLVNNALFVAQVGLAIDAVRIAGSLGIAEDAILAALPHGSGASRALGVVANGGSVAAMADRLAPLMRKDVDMVHAVAERSGTDLGIVGTVLSSDAVGRAVLARR